MMKFITENKSIVFDEVALENGYACYISGSGSLVYGIEVQDTSEYVALENHSPYWCRPFWGSSLSELPSKTQALLIKNGDNYTYYLPICDSLYKTLIKGGKGGFEFYTYVSCNGVACERQLAFI